ncbi:MAG: OmpW family protein [Rhodospirillales bacterium CG15_BIG_FIL_POST_REV_8_21_14_020_66_15]|nr:MAG: OmpW family protein [Rhodospirillales bacterium CG15_BIG_FIL_POST_REV_8_21_14_020_66_15]
MRSIITGVLALALAGAAAAPAAAAEPGDILMRLRGIGFMTDTDGTTDALGGRASTSDDYVPELDFTYFFTKSISAELILATTKHRVSVRDSTSGNLDLGTVRALPPVLTLQYHFNPDGTWNPYVGAGVNYTITYADKKGPSVNRVSYSDEFGYAFQAGVDYKLNDKWSLNFDVKKVFVSTDIKANGGAINAKGTDLDPWVVGIGVGYKF